MNKNSNTLFGSKQNNTVVKNIVEAEPMMFGVPTESNKVGVKFAVHSGNAIAKGRTDGELVFNAITGNTGAIYLGDTLVSSKILDVTYAPKTDASAGIKEIVIKYLDDSGVINTTDALEVVDDARVAALIADFKKDVFDPYKTATDASIARIDTSVNNLEDWVKTAGNLTEAANGAITVKATAGENGFQTWTVGTKVDNKTIVVNGEDKLATAVKIQYVAAAEGVPAHIALTDKDGGELSTVEVSDLVGNGMLDHSSYDKETGILTLYFATAEAGVFDDVTIDLTALLDVTDVLVADGSKKYVDINLTGGENGQFVLSTKMQKVSTATADATGLVDAWDVKSTLDASFGALKADLDASTNYISVGIEQENGRIQNLTVNSSISDVTASAGVRGNWTVSEEGVATISGETAPSISGVANSLVDGAQAIEAIKTYVDAKVAAEAAERSAKIEGSVKALDSTKSADGTNTHASVTLTDGKISGLTISEDYATVTRTAHVDKTESAEMVAAKFEVQPGDEGKLVKASNLADLKSYADDKIAEAVANQAAILEGLDATVSSDSTNVNVEIVEENGKLVSVSVSEDYAKVATSKVGEADTTLTVSTEDEGKLVKASDLSTVAGFANTRIAEEITKLDKHATDTKDTDEYITITLSESDGIASVDSISLKIQEVSSATALKQGLADSYSVKKYVDDSIALGLSWTVI